MRCILVIFQKEKEKKRITGITINRSNEIIAQLYLIVFQLELIVYNSRNIFVRFHIIF